MKTMNFEIPTEVLENSFGNYSKSGTFPISYGLLSYEVEDGKVHIKVSSYAGPLQYATKADGYNKGLNPWGTNPAFVDLPIYIKVDEKVIIKVCEEGDHELVTPVMFKRLEAIATTVGYKFGYDYIEDNSSLFELVNHVYQKDGSWEVDGKTAYERYDVLGNNVSIVSTPDFSGFTMWLDAEHKEELRNLILSLNVGELGAKRFWVGLADSKGISAFEDWNLTLEGDKNLTIHWKYKLPLDTEEWGHCQIVKKESVKVSYSSACKTS